VEGEGGKLKTQVCRRKSRTRKSWWRAKATDRWKRVRKESAAKRQTGISIEQSEEESKSGGRKESEAVIEWRRTEEEEETLSSASGNGWTEETQEKKMQKEDDGGRGKDNCGFQLW
jgi:hypothetical protein